MAAIVTLAGCRSVPSSPQYTLYTTYSESPTNSPQTDSAQTYWVSPEELNNASQSTAHATRFPPLRLTVGEAGEVNLQHFVKVPADFDRQTGKPIAFERRGVGFKLKACIMAVSNETVTMSIDLEDVSEPEWRNVTLADDLPQVRMPRFKSKAIRTPTIQFYEGATLRMGGMISESNSGTNINVWSFTLKKE